MKEKSRRILKRMIEYSLYQELKRRNLK